MGCPALGGSLLGHLFYGCICCNYRGGFYLDDIRETLSWNREARLFGPYRSYICLWPGFFPCCFDLFPEHETTRSLQQPIRPTSRWLNDRLLGCRCSCLLWEALWLGTYGDSGRTRFAIPRLLVSRHHTDCFPVPAECEPRTICAGHSCVPWPCIAGPVFARGNFFLGLACRATLLAVRYFVHSRC